ncbi:MAG: hypothetical protein XD50_1117 [Clostridia bacterium 41_269]|nr:MAG: hypothetical protein XD50_1117 [Clostridia bacterium 41_269]
MVIQEVVIGVLQHGHNGMPKHMMYKEVAGMREEKWEK